MKIVYWIYNFLWGDLLKIPLPGGNSVALSLLVLILVPAGIFFMIRTRFLPIRLFPDMLKITVSTEKKVGWSLRTAGIDRINSHQSRHGKSGRCCRSCVSRRCRCRILDVGNRNCRFGYRIY